MLSYFRTFKILPIQFTEPWWHLIVAQKWLFLFLTLAMTVAQVFWSLTPFIAVKLFENESYFLCIGVFVSWFFLDMVFAFMRIEANTKFQLQCVYSIYQNAHMRLLTIDPKYHVYRSSGKTIAKIERAARGYEDFADYITFEFTPLFIGLLTIIITLAYYSLLISVIATTFIIAILGIGWYFSHYKCQIWEDAFIQTDDSFKAIALENLTQIQLIRATFASYFRSKTLKSHVSQNINTEASLWRSYAYLFNGLELLYLFSLFVLAMALISHIKHSGLTAATAVGLFLIYVQSSKEIIRFGRLLRKTKHSKTAITDLYQFVQNFGKQTFPVLEESMSKVDKEMPMSIEAPNIYFDYGNAILFNDHSFNLICAGDHASKLYGIIGASGSGKTTLLSILGGQLKPIRGNIIINNIDIYAVGDEIRSQLIALQGQISSNLYGTVKHNMLLGLPKNHRYTDEDLYTVLKKVGLFNTLTQHKGLETLLGEGGLNFSGGQRQRLNFAGLYLRASFYKPVLILIDEPTSSLDEISEAAITSMIEELSQDAITLVVAHRLKTIEKATGIIDLSLLGQEKMINVYSQEDLLAKSRYYSELLQGRVQLDE